MTETVQEWADRVARLVAAEVVRAATPGLAAAAPILVSAVRAALGTPAPPADRSAPGRKFGGGSTRTVTPATAGQPMRRVSGKTQSATQSALLGPGRLGIFVAAATAAGGFPYPAYHDVVTPGWVGSGQHPFTDRALAVAADQVATAVISAVRLEVS